ncbi:hypothetical protein [Streptomyces sp. NPDC093223]|uniref:hypothetical protein n=1 Tax=Streptomyces sp. NPDC093223 TaxID=3366033 RepID=UPI003823E1E5
MPSPLSVTGPLAQPAATIASTLYNISKDAGSDVRVTRMSNDTYSMVPPEYAPFVDDRSSPVNSISGMFFTHTRFKHFQRRIGVTESVGAQMPWQMQFMVVKLNESVLRGNFLRKMQDLKMPTVQEIRDSERKIEENGQQIAYIQQLLAGIPDPSSALPATQRQVASLHQQWRSLQAEMDFAQTTVQLAYNYSEQRQTFERWLQHATRQYYISNFTFNFTNQFRTYKLKASTGVKVRADVEVGVIGGRLITVSLRWHEDHLIGRGGNWAGSIKVGCDGQGRVHLDGEGAFWQRYLELNGDFRG